MTDIWNLCQGLQHISSLNCIACRIVEDQSKTATRGLVDSSAEHDILEDLIESVKPGQLNKDYHYLLATPFRYPPLKYRSRFGSKLEPSLWYGSLRIETALAEKAFYSLNFLRASAGKFDQRSKRYSIYFADVKTRSGINLTSLPFHDYFELISSPHSYEETQKLGSEMRNHNVEAFYYHSARCPNQGTNIALFTPKAFKTKSPKEPFQSWEAIVIDKSLVEFTRRSSLKSETLQFSSDLFTINGTLPFPP